MSDDIELPGAGPSRKPKGRRRLLALAVPAGLLLAAGLGAGYFAGFLGRRGGNMVATTDEKMGRVGTATQAPTTSEAEEFFSDQGGARVAGSTDGAGATTDQGGARVAGSMDGAGATTDQGGARVAGSTDGAGATTDQAHVAGPRKLLFYRNPMNPTVTSPVPAKDEMGMDYVPVYADELQTPGRGVEGYATVTVGPEALRVAGVQTAPATRQKLGRAVRAVGIVLPDETRIRHVHTKISGWIEKLYANFTGQSVQRGEPLLSIYSPELLASQEEFLRARDTAAKFDRSSSPDVRKLGEELLQSARRRLQLFDVPEAFLAEIETTGQPQRAVTLSAPVTGFVTAKDIFEGQKVEPGLELFTVTDLSRVWIEADLYEYEARSVRVGQEATLALAYDLGVRLKGRVAYVYPYLSADSRTLKVRFEFPNPKLALKPQMFADVFLSLDAVEGVVIPDSALIDTGVRQVVFVDAGAGSFEPREVKVGPRSEGKVQVLAGVKEGERVVIRANFLLDSESRLRAALLRLTGGGK